MGLILLSMTMFFAMLFATVHALKDEARQDRKTGVSNVAFK
ncbi:hypothetical protein QO002_002533 [Pararhizobium capsulatum DSM 1112]|uniref:Uncharacterized protein n=1 Tax=Pararhizobium capsulatum DSM 1112 TaxID=1121113 RepID=A0ABU0BQ79_9HYPH|nr:hypothetical protein [Pararhizobium capsulatum]MDQ0320395.1 hypothetical protein [Pararhizobium capsulatum DSM 1112]